MKTYRIGTHPDGRRLMIQWSDPSFIIDQWINVTELLDPRVTPGTPKKFMNRVEARRWIDQEIEHERAVKDNQKPGWEIYPRTGWER